GGHTRSLVGSAPGRRHRREGPAGPGGRAGDRPTPGARRPRPVRAGQRLRRRRRPDRRERRPGLATGRLPVRALHRLVPVRTGPGRRRHHDAGTAAPRHHRDARSRPRRPSHRGVRPPAHP
ncbi:MAG: hypothetical protein AVDCRST_MAG54-973, partial [uncultured Actinomycetospora sp.]